MATRSTRRQAFILGTCVLLSIAGLILHNAREFGFAALADPATGTVPYAFVQVALFALWALSPRSRPTSEILLAATAVLQLIGGGIISVLPFPFLPFEPEQSLSHYASHVLLALLQLPLLIYPLRLRWIRRNASR